MPKKMFMVLKRLKEWLPKAKARRKLEKYDKKFSRARPMIERPEPLHVEETFDSFVMEFGGVKISDLISKKSQMPQNADYLFEEYNVIVELKTLEGIYSGPDAYKQLSQAYIDAGCTGSDMLGLLWRREEIPEPVAELMRKRVRRSIEQRVKKARKQLKKSKAFFGNSDTHCLILIAMDQQPLFGHQTMLFNLAKIMGDNYSDEQTDGVIYFNPNTPTKLRSDGLELSGWYPIYRDDDVNEKLVQFVNLLGNRWLTFFGNKIGELNPILELETEEEMKAMLKRL